MEVDSYQNKPEDIQWRRDDSDGIVVLQSLLNDRCEGGGKGDGDGGCGGGDGDGGGDGCGIVEIANGDDIYGNHKISANVFASEFAIGVIKHQNYWNLELKFFEICDAAGLSCSLG